MKIYNSLISEIFIAFDLLAKHQHLNPIRPFFIHKKHVVFIQWPGAV